MNEEELNQLKEDFKDWQEIFQKELNTLGNENLDMIKRIEKLEHDRDAMQNWGRQFDFMDKQSFKSIRDKLKTFPEILLEKDKEILELKKIISDFAGMDKQTGQSETYNSLLLRVHTENRELNKEIEKLKSELVVWVDAESERTNALMRTNKIIEQALEHNSKRSPTINRREMKEILEGST